MNATIERTGWHPFKTYNRVRVREVCGNCAGRGFVRGGLPGTLRQVNGEPNVPTSQCRACAGSGRVER